MSARGFQRAVFNQATAARHQVVGPPAANKKIRVRGCTLTAAAAQDAVFESGAVNIGPVNLINTGTFVLRPTDGGVGEAWMECEPGEALNITLGQAEQTDGVIFYDIMEGT